MQRGGGFFFQQRIVFQKKTQFQRAEQPAYGFLRDRRRQHFADFRRGARANGRHQHVVALEKRPCCALLRQHHIARPRHFSGTDLPPLNHHRPRGRLKPAVVQFLPGFAFILIHQPGGFAHHQYAGGTVQQFGGGKFGRSFFQIVPRTSQQFQTVRKCRFRAGVVATAEPSGFPKRDFQTARRLAGACGKRLFVFQTGIQRARLRLCGNIEQYGAVAYAAGQYMVAHQPLPCFRNQRPVSHPAARGFQAEQAAIVRGQTYRAAAVATVCGRHHPRRHGCRRTAAAAAGRVGGIPRITCDAVDFRFGNRISAPFGRGGFAEYPQPGIQIGLGKVAVLSGNIILHHARTRPSRRACPVGQQIFQQKRHTCQRRLIVCRHLPAQGALAQIVRQKVEFGVDFIQPCQCGLQHFVGRNFFAADKIRQSDGIVAAVFGEIHDRSLCARQCLSENKFMLAIAGLFVSPSGKEVCNIL